MPKKLLVFAQRFPPSIGGTPSGLRNLFSGFPNKNFAVISLGEPGVREKCNSSYPQFRLRWPCKFIRKFDSTFLSLVPWVVLRSLRLTKRKETYAVFANFPGVSFLLAGWLVSKLRGVDLYIYFHDVFEENCRLCLQRWVARRFEKRICRDAKKIFCISIALRDFFTKKYRGASVIWLPQCIELNKHVVGNRKITYYQRWKKEDETLIVFTGQIYESSVDPIHNLIATFNKITALNPRLIISTPDPAYRLAKCGISKSNRVEIVFLKTEEEVQLLQKEADILFNPVSFKFSDKVQIQTLFPLKTTEYLRAGRPMLVHGPPTALFVKYVQEKGFATVVDKPDTDLLAAAIREIMGTPNPPAQKEACRRELARRDSRIIPKKLLTEIGLL